MKVKKRTGIKILIAVILAGSVYTAFLHTKIYTYSHREVSKGADYLIILGARVKGTVPSLALQYRIDEAANYLKENPTTIVIVSGGKGPGEDITEAEAMQTELIAQGIASSRIILEDRSTTTDENIHFSKQLIPADKEKGLLVTNDFHIYRAIKIAEQYDLEMGGIPAKTPEVIIVKTYVREYMAITKFYLWSLFK